MGVCVYDVAHWPDEEHAHPARALPPLIERHTIRAYSPRIPFIALLGGWLCWGGLVTVRVARYREQYRRGLEVQPAAKAAG